MKNLNCYATDKRFLFNVKTITSTNDKCDRSSNFTPKKTCDIGSCPLWKSKECYALNGRYCFKNVIQANDNRLDLYNNNPDLYFDLFRSELINLSNKKKNPLKYFRVNGSGDTPDQEYVTRLFKMIRSLPHINFWIATRKKSLYDNHITPINCIVRYSKGIKGDYMSDVSEDITEVNCPCNPIHNIKKCSICGFKCWNKKIKVITYLLKTKNKKKGS